MIYYLLTLNTLGYTKGTVLNRYYDESMHF